MNHEDYSQLFRTLRRIANKKGVKEISLSKLYNNQNISDTFLDENFKTDSNVVEKLLEEERKGFENIFEKNNFNGNNAIDILVMVSREIANNFYQLNPSITQEFSLIFPEVYEKHLEKRIHFVYQKIRINLHKGVSQGFYRNDFGIELVARLYIKRLIDLHNPENFPPLKFTFDDLFKQMFDNFVESIATDKGLKYWKENKY